ncbi:MAG: O-antigen ligase family protein [Wenzhouxiangella sp.]
MLSLLQVAILCFCASILAREPQAFALTWLIYICVMAYVALDVILGLPFFGMRLPGYSGFFQNNRNALSYQWAMGAVTCLWFVFRVPKSQTLNQVACYSLLMLFSAAVFAAGSRTGAGALVIALMAILFFEFRKRSLPLYVTAIPVVISALWFMLMGSEGLLLRFQRTFAGEDYGVRDVIFEHAWVLAKARPMFGYGPTYVFDLGPALGWRALAAHSAYFHMLLTAGFLGSFVFIALLVRIALELRTHWAMPTARLAAALLLLSLAFGVTGNLFNSEVFWVLLGMCMSVRYWYVPTAINGASIRALLTGHGSAQKRHCSRFNSPVPW